MSLVAWNQAQSLNPEWIDWDTYTGLGTEARLSAICAQALEIEKLGQHYGLRIPGQILSPAQGEQHLLQVLTALACFDDPQNDASRTPYSGPQSEAPE